MKHNTLISLHINSSEITPEQFNAIMAFCTIFWSDNPGEIEVICDKFPFRSSMQNTLLQVNSVLKVSRLFAKGICRNLSIVKSEDK